MDVNILRAYLVNGKPYGECYVYNSEGDRILVVFNGDDMKVISHFVRREIADCIGQPSQVCRDAVTKAIMNTTMLTVEVKE